MPTDISIVSSASILVGGNAIVSFEDGSVEAEVAATLYEDTRDDLLSSEPWTFNKKISTMLSQLVAVPNDRWDFAYQLPSDFINFIALNREVGDFEIYEDKLLANYDGEVYIEYQFSVTEEQFPSYFTNFLKITLASLFAIPITDDPGKLNSYVKLADAQGKAARRIDSKQKINRRIGGRKSQGNPFTNVRG